MRSGTKLVLLLAVVTVLGLTLTPVPSSAGNLYLGGGTQSTSFNKEAGGFFSADIAGGFNLNVGYRVSPKIAIDLMYGQSKHDENISGTEFTHSWLEIGPKLYFNTESTIQPYIIAGGGKYDDDIQSRDYSSLGAFIGAGIEERGGRNHIVGLFARGNTFSDDSPRLSTKTFTAGVYYNYYFGY